MPIASIFTETIGNTLFIYTPKRMAERAIGAENPIIELTQPETNPIAG